MAIYKVTYAASVEADTEEDAMGILDDLGLRDDDESMVNGLIDDGLWSEEDAMDLDWVCDERHIHPVIDGSEQDGLPCPDKGGEA